MDNLKSQLELLDLDKIGPDFENNSMFPDRVNTEFVEVIDKTTLKMRVYERGSGETMACGTGACATVVAGTAKGLLNERATTVDLPGGNLLIEYSMGNEVYMTGPATTVCNGSYFLPAELENK